MADAGHRMAEGAGLSGPEAGSAAARALETGQAFVLLLDEDDAAREAALRFVLDATADGRTRVTRVSNPLRARLTLERLLIQMIAGGVESTMSDPASLVRQMAARWDDEVRVVLVIERADTLDPEALRFLGQAEPMFNAAEPRLQVLFVGRPEFHAMLSDPEAGMERHVALFEACCPREPETTSAIPLIESPEDVVPISREMRHADGSWRRFAIVAGTLGGIAALSLAGFLLLTTAKPMGAGPTRPGDSTASAQTSGPGSDQGTVERGE